MSGAHRIFFNVLYRDRPYRSHLGLPSITGMAYSNHSLFRLTGSFFNPGPYSGYLAITLPVALGILLEQSKRNMPYYLSMGCIGTAIVVLPAGMSDRHG